MKTAIYFGDVFWSTIPYQGLSLYYELSKKMEVLPIFNTGDIRLHKKWRGDEKFRFNTSLFKEIPFIESSDLLSTLKSCNIKTLIISLQMQFKANFSARNRSIAQSGIDIFLYDCGGCDSFFINSHGDKHLWWSKFFIKSNYFKKCLSDPLVSTKIKKSLNLPLGLIKHEDVIPSGCIDYDELSPNYDFHIKNDVLDKISFCKKYNLDPNKKIISYIPGNPSVNHKYVKLLSELNNLLLELQSDFGYQVCFKSHPNDYISSESPSEYSSIHPRAQMGGYSGPRHLCEGFNNFTTIEAQDGYNLYRSCDFGVTDLSHSGFELGFLNKKCFSYKMKEYEGWHMVEDLCESCYVDCNDEADFKDKILSFDLKTDIEPNSLKDYFGDLSGSSYKNISSEILNILNKNE